MRRIVTCTFSSRKQPQPRRLMLQNVPLRVGEPPLEIALVDRLRNDDQLRDRVLERARRHGRDSLRICP